MSHIALLFCVALAMPPNPAGTGSFSPSKMAARPLPDNELKQGTVSVLVRQGKIGAQGVEVWLLPATAAASDKPALDAALTGGKTNANGRLFLQGASYAGREVVVWVKLSHGYQRSVPFQIPVLGGVRLLFLSGASSPHGGKGTPTPGPTGPHGHNHGMGSSVPQGPVTRDPSNLRLWISFRVMAIESEKIYLAVTYSVVNHGLKTYHAGDHGLLLPMPEGAKSVALPRGTRGASVQKGRVLTLRPVPTGRHGLQLTATCNIPYDKSEQLVRLRSHLPLRGYAVSIKKYRQVRIGGTGLDKPVSSNRGEANTPWLVYRSTAEGYPRNEIRFRVERLPVRSRLGAWLFGGIALLLVLAAIGLTIVYGRRSRKKGGTGDSAGDTLVRIERDRLLGVITDGQARHYAELQLASQPSPPKKTTPKKRSKKRSNKRPKNG